LEALRIQTSNNAKISLIKKYVEDDMFRAMIELTMDGNLHYNIKKLPLPTNSERNAGDFWYIANTLYKFAKQRGVTKPEKQLLANLCPEPYQRDIVHRILNKDLKCKVAHRLVNKAVPGLIDIVPYMRCSGIAAAKNVHFPAIVQNKEDGTFVNFFPMTKSVRFMSRNGNDFVFPENSLTDIILENFPRLDMNNYEVYMGEFLVMQNGKYLSRQEGNAIVVKALEKSQTITIDESLQVHIILWDVVTEKEFYEGSSDTPYIERYEKLKWLVERKIPRVKLSETIIVDTIEEAKEFAVERINKGGEGAVLKDFSSIWIDGTSRKQIKLKAGGLGLEGKERECELRVVSFEYGKKGTKYEGCLGGLRCVSEDEALEVIVGSGFTDQQRGFLGFDNYGFPMFMEEEDFLAYMDDTFLGQVITARFNDVIQDKHKQKPRLFLGRFIEVRHDKHLADTLDEILIICGKK
jgi:hypothetical protein